MTPCQGGRWDGLADVSGIELPPGSRARQRGLPAPLTPSRTVGRAILERDGHQRVVALSVTVTTVAVRSFAP